MLPGLRVLNAGNPGPFTLDGTRTHIVGRLRPAVVDPGPDVNRHVRAVASALVDAEAVLLLLTHGHADHAGGTDALADLLTSRGVRVDVAGAGHPRARPLTGGDSVRTDAGELVALATPGHAPDHLAFHWPLRRSLFAGDLLLGRGDTTWVAGHPGCVADYLASLDRLRRLDLDVVLPAHGPPLEDPTDALDRFEAHRRERIEQVRRARTLRPDASAERLVDLVYGGTVPRAMRRPARESIEAILEYLDDPDRRRGGPRRRTPP